MGSQSDIEEGGSESDDEGELKSPFLGGVGVVRFWLIFAGVLANYFVGCFDSTVSVITMESSRVGVGRKTTNSSDRLWCRAIRSSRRTFKVRIVHPGYRLPFS